MNTNFEAVNSILAEWDPIGVREIAKSEYMTYVPRILRVIKDKQKLRYCLEDILINQLGLAYDPNNKEHLLDLQAVRKKLMKVDLVNTQLSFVTER